MSVKPVILRARVKQTASLIFLHGLGDTGHGWARILNNIRTDSLKVSLKNAVLVLSFHVNDLILGYLSDSSCHSCVIESWTQNASLV